MLGNLLEPTWRYRATVPGLPEVVAGARRMKLPPDSSEPDFPQRGGLLEEDEKKKEAEEECAAEEEAMAAEKEEGEQGEQGEQVRRLVHAEKVALADSVQLIAARERFCKSKELEGQSSTVSQGDNCKRINNASKREQVSRLQGAQDKVTTTNTRTRRASKNTLPCVEQVHEEPRLNYVADDQHARRGAERIHRRLVLLLKRAGQLRTNGHHASERGRAELQRSISAHRPTLTPLTAEMVFGLPATMRSAPTPPRSDTFLQRK